MLISFDSVLMPFTQKCLISPCLSKLQLAKVGSFFETQCRIASLASRERVVCGLCLQQYMTPPALALFGPINIPANAYNCYRVYGSILLLLMFICVFIGVKFVSKFSPIALFCVIFSILCVYIGIFISNPDRGPRYFRPLH